MASFDMNLDFPTEDLLSSDFKEIATESIKEAVPILEKSIKSGCAGVIKSGRTALVNSIKGWGKIRYSPSKDCYVGGVSFYGKPAKQSTRSNGNRKSRRSVSFQDIAFWLEHGNAHQPARPFMDRSVKSCESRVLEIAQKKFNEKTGAK